MLTDEQIIALRNKYKNPLNVKKSIENIAEIIVDKYHTAYKEVTMQPIKKLKLQDNNYIQQLETVLLDQIQKLNDDSIQSTDEETKKLYERSNAISNLAKNFSELQRTKLDIVKLAIQGEGLYDNVLGIE